MEEWVGVGVKMYMKEVGGGGSVQGEVMRVAVVLRWVLGVVWGVKRAAGIGACLGCAFYIRDGEMRVFGLGWVMQVGAAVVRLCVAGVCSMRTVSHHHTREAPVFLGVGTQVSEI